MEGWRRESVGCHDEDAGDFSRGQQDRKCLAMDGEDPEPRQSGAGQLSPGNSQSTEYRAERGIRSSRRNLGLVRSLSREQWCWATDTKVP